LFFSKNPKCKREEEEEEEEEEEFMCIENEM
jgi:hypothetical protein